ncbi:MAG: tetratricopeptide repeat protein [Candidatus Wallbacteria bacterium]|nr:tetratricopeptide repeat protein [Candidatus Wallbacteria bacterium]
MAKVYKFDKFRAAEEHSRTEDNRTDTIQQRVDQAKSLLQGGIQSQALSMFQEILKQDPDNFDALLYLGNIYFNQAEMSHAIPMYERLIKAHPGISFYPYINILRALLKVRQYDKLNDYGAKCLETFPHQAEPFKLIGISQYFQGNFSGAVDQLKRYLERDSFDPECIYYLGLTYKSTENYDAAIYYFQRLAKIIPEDIETVKVLGFLHLKKRDYKSAVSHFEELYSKFNDFSVGKELAFIYLYLKEFAKAEILLSSLLLSAPYQTDLLLALGELFLDSDQSQKAQQHLKNAYLANSQDPQVTYRLATGFQKLANIPQAIFYLQKTISLKPDFIDPYLDLYHLFEQTGESDDKFARIKLQLLNQKWEIPEYYYLMARLLEREGEISKSTDFIKNCHYNHDFRYMAEAELLKSRLSFSASDNRQEEKK